MNKKILSILCVLALMISMLGVTAAAEDGPAAKIGETSYDTLQLAVNAVKEGEQNGLIVLQQPVASVEIDCDVYVDLKGYNIGSLTVNNGTFYGMDSETDDFEIDAVNHTGYGKIGEIKGNAANVKGIPVGNENAAEGCSYLMVEEDGIGTSFHCVNLKLENMTLRPNEVGLYFQSNFGGDALVAERVDTFGVALSLKGDPTAENLATDCKLSEFTDFQAGVNNTNTSTILQGVMKETNPKLVNRANSQRSVYGRAYVEIDDTYIFGNARSRSLEEQVVELSKDETKVTDDVVTMYETYRSVMKTWEGIDPIVSAYEDSILWILGIGNSYTWDSMQLLNEIYKIENPGKRVSMAFAYKGGCKISEHVSFIENNSNAYTYYYVNENGTWSSESSVTLGYIVSQHDWDLVSMQQGSSSSGKIDTYDPDKIQYIRSFVNGKLGYEPTYMWNMTWAWPESNESLASTYVDQDTMYSMIVDCVQQRIVPDTVFKYILPVGTAIQNARSSFLDDSDLNRDNSHVSDLGRLIAAYVWYCEIEGKTLDQIGLTVIPEALTEAGNKGDIHISDAVADIVEESVKNALAYPFQVTQSLFTEE